jgi:sortase A
MLRQSRTLWIAEALLLIAGSVLAGWFLWAKVTAEVDQSWAKYELSATLRGVKPTIGGYLKQFVSGEDLQPKPEQKVESPTPPATQPPPPITLSRGDTVGRIEIPRLSISAIVRHGVDKQTLRRAVGHVPETPLPGQPGNTGLAAHRDTHFRNLKGMKVGDLVRVVTPRGEFEYKVESLKIVLPKNVEVLDPTPEPALTLVTCYPFNYIGSAPKRFIVRAKQIMPTANAAL